MYSHACFLDESDYDCSFLLNMEIQMINPQDIVAYRKRMGYSQEKLGMQIGVTQATIGAWERGQSKPRKDVADRLRRDMFAEQEEDGNGTPPPAIAPERVTDNQRNFETEKVFWLYNGLKHEIHEKLLIIRDGLNRVMAIIEL